MAANGGRGNGAPIPAALRKTVQSLKEIVNCPEQEIYAILHECNMDPSEAINRLLNQDTFQEVKSKRDKKKEIKDTSESKSRGTNNALNRSGRFSTDRAGRVASNNSSSNGRAKPLLKKENGPNTSSSSSAPGYGGSGNKQSAPLSMTASNEAALLEESVAADSNYMPPKPTMVFQHAWSGIPGQMSMADVVKMGRPQAKSTKATLSPEMPNVSHDVVTSNLFHSHAKLPTSTVYASEAIQERHSSLDHIPNISNAVHDSEPASDEHVSVDSWSLVDQLPTENNIAVSLTSSGPVFSDPSEPSNLKDDRLNLPVCSPMGDNEIYTTNFDPNAGIVERDSTKSMALERLIQSAPRVDDGPFEHREFYEHAEHEFQHCEVEDNPEASSVVVNMQQLSLQNETIVERSRDNNPSVIFPDHLQVNVDCSHLSFGSFGSGISANFSGSLLSKSQKSTLEASSASAEVPVDPLDASIHTGNPEHYNGEQLRTTSDEDLDHETSTPAENYDRLASPQPAVIGSASSDPSNELQYNLTSSMPNYAFSGTAQPVDQNYSETISQAQTLAALSNQAYPISLPTNASEPTLQTGREFDLPYPSAVAQQLLAKFNSGISSLDGPALSLTESVKPSLFSMLQPTNQPSTSSGLPTGHSVPQHLPVPHYSQPSLPFGPFTNMISYPFLPPSYTYLPSAAFQQAYTGSNAYHQSPAAVHSAGIKYALPQYKNSASVSSLPESAIMQSSYGGFGSSANIPGSFMLNPQTVSASTTLGYNDTLSSHQFKDGSHYSSLQQGENSALWLQQAAASSRTIPSLPTNAFYNLQGQSQHSGYRQSQQQQQQQQSQYGTPAFSNFYSHAGPSQEHPQNPNSGNLNRSQGIPSQSSHQLWQSNY